MTRRPPLLERRQSTHGDFALNAEISQNLKREFEKLEQYVQLSDIHRECLDMIALKLSRILSGNAEFKDHWDDIAGYAQLGAEACDGDLR